MTSELIINVWPGIAEIIGGALVTVILMVSKSFNPSGVFAVNLTV